MNCLKIAKMVTVLSPPTPGHFKIVSDRGLEFQLPISE